MFNIYKALTIGLVFGTIYQLPYAGVMLAALMLFFACTYYTVVFLTMTGILETTIFVKDFDFLKEQFVTILSNTTGVLTLYLATSYGFIAYFSFPWILLTIATLVAAVLLYYDILELDVDENEEDGSEDDEENRD